MKIEEVRREWEQWAPQLPLPSDPAPQPPEGYSQQLQKAVNVRLQSSPKEPPKQKMRTSYDRWSVAAAVLLLLIAIAGWYDSQSQLAGPISVLSDEEITEYVQTHIDEFETSMLMDYMEEAVVQ